MNVVKYRGDEYRATPKQLAELGVIGRHWYSVSRNSIAAYAKKQGVTVKYTCDVLAIVSPRVSVERSVKIAKDYIERDTYTLGLMGARIRALQRYERYGEIMGPKIEAFSRALQGDETACVIDAWVLRGLGLERTRPNKRKAERSIRSLATYLGWPVAQTQASVWTGARILTGVPRPHAPLRLA